MAPVRLNPGFSFGKTNCVPATFQNPWTSNYTLSSRFFRNCCFFHVMYAFNVFLVPFFLCAGTAVKGAEINLNYIIYSCEVKVVVVVVANVIMVVVVLVAHGGTCHLCPYSIPFSLSLLGFFLLGISFHCVEPRQTKACNSMGHNGSWTMCRNGSGSWRGRCMTHLWALYGTMAWGIWYIRKYPVVSSSDGKVNGERTIAVLWDFNISSPISSVLRTHASCKILCFGVSNISRVSIFHLGKTRRSPADLARGQESLPELMFHSADQI